MYTETLATRVMFHDEQTAMLIRMTIITQPQANAPIVSLLQVNRNSMEICSKEDQM